MFGFGAKKVTCVSCRRSVPASEVRTTHRNGEDLPLCAECWGAAIQVQNMMRPANRAEAARDRWVWKQSR